LNRVFAAVLGLAVLIAIFAVSALPSSPASASPGGGATIYGTDGGTTGLYEINKTTGVGVLKGTMGIGTAPALATDPLTGNLYAGTGGSTNDLYLVNPANAMSTLVGSGAGLGGAGFGGFDFDASGQLWASANLAGSSGVAGTGSDHLVKVNKVTGIATVVGSFGTCTGVTIPAPASGPNGSCTIEGIETIAFDSSGQLWGIENERGDAGTPGLYKINSTTGAATFQVAIDDAAAGLHPSGGVVGMQFDCDGTLYAGTARRQGSNTDGGKLGTVNTTTGLFTFISAAPVTTGSPANSLAGLADIPSNCPFNVNKDFQPNDPGSVTVSVTCTDGGTGMAIDSSASEADDANFNINGFTLGTDPNCTASETGVPAGYTTGNTCSALLSVGSCTIVNPETSTTFTVNKVYSPSGPVTPVTVTVTCTSGTVTPPSGPSSPSSPFVATVTHFNVSGTTCSAVEVVPAGYVATSNCSSVPISHGVPASCTITNTLITPSPSPTPVSSAVGGMVELFGGGSDGGSGGSVLVMLVLLGAAATLGGGTYAYVRKRS